MDTTRVTPLPIQHDSVSDVAGNNDTVHTRGVSEHLLVANTGHTLNLREGDGINPALTQLIGDSRAQHLIQQDRSSGSYQSVSLRRETHRSSPSLFRRAAD